MEQAILFGNGFNRITNEKCSWDDILSSKVDKDLRDISYTLQYESAYLKEYQDNSKSNDETSFKEDILRGINSDFTNKVYEILADSPIKYFITTNYNTTLDNVLNIRGFRLKIDTKRLEKIYSIRRKHRLTKGADAKEVWYAHGEVSNPKSIMLGYDHYCGSLSKINDYIKGKYDYLGERKIPSIEKRINDKIYDIHSWIDLFFFADLHIIALGLDFSENDIWWILNKRQRLIVDRKVNELPNKIYFYMTEDDLKKRTLLEYFGVEVIEYTVTDNNYEDIYSNAIRSVIDRSKEYNCILKPTADSLCRLSAVFVCFILSHSV